MSVQKSYLTTRFDTSGPLCQLPILLSILNEANWATRLDKGKSFGTGVEGRFV